MAACNTRDPWGVFLEQSLPPQGHLGFPPTCSMLVPRSQLSSVRPQALPSASHLSRAPSQAWEPGRLEHYVQGVCDFGSAPSVSLPVPVTTQAASVHAPVWGAAPFAGLDGRGGRNVLDLDRGNDPAHQLVGGAVTGVLLPVTLCSLDQPGPCRSARRGHFRAALARLPPPVAAAGSARAVATAVR